MKQKESQQVRTVPKGGRRRFLVRVRGGLARFVFFTVCTYVQSVLSILCPCVQRRQARGDIRTREESQGDLRVFASSRH